MATSGNKRPENEALFRAANQNLKATLGALEEGGRVPFICECSDAECMEIVDLPVSTYDEIHSRDRFLLLAGHETADDEAVVARRDGYVVVKKHVQPS